MTLRLTTKRSNFILHLHAKLEVCAPNGSRDIQEKHRRTNKQTTSLILIAGLSVTPSLEVIFSN